MKQISKMILFYRRIFWVSFIISAIPGIFGLALLGGFSLQGMGIAYLIIAPAVHFYIYEIRSPQEYYFYYNLGLSKLKLWVSSVLISLIIALFFMLI